MTNNNTFDNYARFETDVEKASALARIAHAGQVDNAGEDYFKGHITRVVCRLAKSKEIVFGDLVLAYLHDIVEDTAVTTPDLYTFGLGSYVNDVNTLTRREDETYADYIYRVSCGSSSARNVKIADLEDHLDTTEISDSLAERYRNAIDDLIR